jgi:hypothetical protein
VLWAEFRYESAATKIKIAAADSTPPANLFLKVKAHRTFRALRRPGMSLQEG